MVAPKVLAFIRSIFPVESYSARYLFDQLGLNGQPSWASDDFVVQKMQ